MKKFLSILLATLLVASLVPALLVGAAAESQKASAITEAKNGRIYHYYETFDDVDATQGAEKVMAALGWSLPDNDDMLEAHEANVAATESGLDSTYMYEIKDGKLYLRNRGTENEYVLIADSAELAEVFKDAFVIEYTQTYLATSTSTSDGYVSLMYNTDSSLARYGESALRISGWGNSRTYGTALDAGDISYSVYNECGVTNYDVEHGVNLTLYERLFGDVSVVPGTSSDRSLKGSKVMVDKEMRVRLEFDGVIGPRIFVNDILVSDPRNIASERARTIAQESYADYLSYNGSKLALCVTPGIDCIVDEITIYETRVASTPSLYITEIATLPTNAAAPYIELYNAGDSALSLNDYVGGYIVVDAKGNETVVTAAFNDYIGQSFTVGGVEIAGLAASKATLAAGESVLVFPVDPDAPMTVAEFCAEYGLDASQKVLPISGETFVVDPTEYRYWFVADYKNEADRPYHWNEYSASDMAVNESVESIVELVPSVAFGYGDDVSESSLMISTDPVAYHFGRGGDVQPGYSAHYIYGANFSAGARTGLMISRCTERIDESKNTGKLLDVQKTYFDRIADFRAGLFNSTGGFAITEYIPVTAENDAYECFELTNIASTALDLYAFALVSSGNAAYGGASWTRATLLEARPTATEKNPNVGGTYMVEPGDSVVVWNKTAAAAGKSVSDFRQYYGLSDSTAVVVAICADTAKNVVAENAGTVSYGVATRADALRFLNGAVPSVANVVSDVLVPLHSIHYAVDGQHVYTWDDIMELGNLDILSAMVDMELEGCEMVGHILPEGTLLNGYFLRLEDAYGHPVFEPCGQGDTVPAGDDTEYFAPKDIEHFFAFGSKQDTSFPADMSVSFSYGASVYASKGSGSLFRDMDILTYNYDMRGRGYEDAKLPYLTDVASRFITTDINSGADAEHTLGTTKDHQGVNVSIKNAGYYTVTYLDANATAVSSVTFNGSGCSDVYAVLSDAHAEWLVNDVKYAAGATVMITSDTVIKPVVASAAPDTNVPGGNGGSSVQPPVEEEDTDDSRLALDNLEPNNTESEETKNAKIVVLATVAAVGCIVIVLGVVLIKKLFKKNK